MANRFASLCPDHVSCGCPYGGNCCFHCVAPECVLIVTPYSLALGARQATIRALRDAGATRETIAEKVGVSVRTVHRAYR